MVNSGGNAVSITLPPEFDYDPRRVTRRQQIVLALAFAVCLVAPSPPRLPGDGGEYFSLALNFADFRGPALAPDAVRAYLRAGGEFQPELVDADPSPFMRAAADGSLDFFHFWFYSLLAAPGVWITRLVGAPPTYAFALLNTGLLLAALAVALPRLGAPTAVLLFASPIVWWIDKAHTEAYTFALVAIAVLMLRERPWWSIVAAGAAAVQNPVAFTFLGLVVAGSLLQSPRMVLDRRWLAGLAVGVGLASMHVTYFWTRYRTPSLLMLTTQEGTPALVEMLVPITDPNLGIVANFPALAIAVAAAVGILAWRRPRALASPDVLVAAVAAAGFLVSFARNTNYHHGGTPSMSRYALWFIPLAMPLLGHAAAAAGGAWQRGMWRLATVSACVSIWAFHPAVPQNTHEPTWVASYLWTTHPTWNDPLPQSFVESVRKTEQRVVPVGTDGCEKILVHGRQDLAGWPMPCYPAEIPAWCADQYCYANLVGGRYVFTRAPGRDRGGDARLDHEVWPRGTEPRVRAFYENMAWQTLRAGLDPDPMFRQVANAHAAFLQGASMTIVVVQEAEAGAAVVMRPSRPFEATLYDPIANEVRAVARFDGPPHDAWILPVPPGEVFLLALRPVGS